MANACISRRAVLRATIPTMASAVALPVLAADAAQSPTLAAKICAGKSGHPRVNFVKAEPAEPPFISLLREWREAYDAAMDEPSEDDFGPLTARLWALGDQAMTLPATNDVELAAKILIISDYGEHNLEHERLAAVVADAQRIAGVPMPATLAAFRARLAAAREAAE